MAFDGGMMASVIREINGFCAGGARVDKVLMPAKDEVVLVLHAGRETKRLQINASSSAPRLTFTSVSKENPLQPPMFCMLLRKHLVGAILTEVRQMGFDRVARLCFSSRDEMGFACDRFLVAEIMGKYSNLMFLDGADRILSVLRPVDFTTSRLRQVLSGMTYELPPPQDKQDPTEATYETFFSTLSATDQDRVAEKCITSAYLGISSQSAREMVYRACGDATATLETCTPTALASVMTDWFEDLRQGNLCPTLVSHLDGSPIDYSYSRVGYFGSRAKTETYSSFGELLDAFFAARDRSERLKLLSADIQHLLKHETSRLVRKSEGQRSELKEAEKAEEYRRCGDLITANLYKIRRGDATALCTDWEREDTPEVAVELDTRLSPSANAQRYYKLYNKAKKATAILTEQLERSAKELAYLESVAVFLDKADTPEDLEAIREELRKEGYLKTPQAAQNKSKKKAIKLKSMKTPGGYRLYIGCNNVQNEYLTFTLADKGDLWFHVKGMPGSHVVLSCHGEEPDAEDYTFAATVAAHYSGAEGKGTAVDYTRVRELKRVAGAHAGYVIYHTNYSAYVDPADFAKLDKEWLYD